MTVKNIELDWLTTEEAAKYFDYDLQRPGSRAAFLQFALRESVPHYRMSNRRFRWSKSQMIDWLEARRLGRVKR